MALSKSEKNLSLPAMGFQMHLRFAYTHLDMCPNVGGIIVIKKMQANPLAAMLRLRLVSEKLRITLLSKRLGIAQSYLSELMLGDKSFSKLDDARLRRIATYLGVPAGIGFILAGRLTYDDFVEKPEALDAKLDAAMSVLMTSTWALEAGVSEQEIRNLPRQMKLMLSLMFQTATGENLIAERRWTLAEYLFRPMHEETKN